MIEIWDTIRNEEFDSLESGEVAGLLIENSVCRFQAATSKLRTAVLQIESLAVFNPMNLYHLRPFELKESSSNICTEFCVSTEFLLSTMTMHECYLRGTFQ